MKALEKVRDTLMGELAKISDKNSINSTDLEHVDKLTHSIKSIDTIVAMEEAGRGYQNDSGYGYGHPDYRYDNYGYANRRRDSMGRYSRDEYPREGGNSYDRNGYSHSNNGQMELLHDMLRDATTEQEREVIRRKISEMERR